eukprot:m.286972 g.286972  ORF g.286972 m.286972 type:complete len:65 (+) comp19941_c0_seq1:376-570(+)
MVGVPCDQVHVDQEISRTNYGSPYPSEEPSSTIPCAIHSDVKRSKYESSGQPCAANPPINDVFW